MHLLSIVCINYANKQGIFFVHREGGGTSTKSLLDYIPTDKVRMNSSQRASISFLPVMIASIVSAMID